MRKYDIKTVFNTNTKIESLFWSPKDKIPEMLTPRIYEIPCSCGKSYIGQTRRATEIQIKEHEKDVDYK